MKNNLVNNLKKLSGQFGVSGFEKENGITDFLFNIVKDINPKTHVDSVGNIISVLGSGKETFILEAHMDEIGFFVRKIKGNIVLQAQGIIKGEKVVGNDVFIVGRNIKGNILINKNRDFIFQPKLESDFNKIKRGDIVAFKRSFSKNRNIIKANSLDNRIGCAVLLDILKKSIKRKRKNRLIFIFSTKEEINKSSFKEVTSLYKDAFAIVIDAAYAQPVDFRIDSKDVNIPILGKGCAFQTKGKGFKVFKKEIEKIKRVAKINKIKIQEESAPSGLGKTNFAQMLKERIKKGVVINIPVRSQHNQISTMNLLDAKSAIDVTGAILESKY